MKHENNMILYSRPPSHRSRGFLGSRCRSCSAGPFLQTDIRSIKKQSGLTSLKANQIKLWDSFTLQGVPGEAQLADDVSGDVGLDALTLLGMALCCFQQMVELLRVKLLQGKEKDLSWPTTLSDCEFHPISSFSVFTPDLFGSVKTNPGRFSWWVRFVWAGVKALDRTLMQTKQTDREKRVFLFRFLCLWCERKQTNRRIL